MKKWITSKHKRIMQRWSQIYRRTNKAKKNLGYETFHYNSAITCDEYWVSNGVINIKCVYYHALKFKGSYNKSKKFLDNIRKYISSFNTTIFRESRKKEQEYQTALKY